MKYKISTLISQFSIPRGFTLVELLISFGILTIALAMLMRVFGSIIDVQLESKAKSEVDQEGRYLIAKLNYNFHNASAIVDPAAPGSSSTLTLTNSADSLNYTYSLDASNNLQIRNNSTSEINVLSSSQVSIPSLSFQRVGNGGSNDTVRVSFTVRSKVVRPSGQESRNFQTTFGLP